MAAVVSCFWEITKENHWMPQFNYVFQGVSGCIAPFWKFCIPILVPLFVFPHHSTSRFHFSFTFSQHSFPFLFLFFFSYFKFLIQISSPVLSVLPGPLLFLYPCVLFYIAASLHQCSDSFLLCFTLLHGQVAEQLAYYGHVSETVITEEMFDAAVQFGTVQGDPTQSWARRPVWIAPGLPQAPTGKGASRTAHLTPQRPRRWAPQGKRGRRLAVKWHEAADLQKVGSCVKWKKKICRPLKACN